MDRKQIFQRLKAPCVGLIEVIASLQQRPNARQEIVQSLTKLLQVLRDVTARPDSLDERLAEFVFVPISHVLRVSGNVPVRALEICLECISILLRTGWKGSISPELLGQLLILFTFLANSSSSGNGIAATSEELQVAAFKCMGELISQSATSTQGKSVLTQAANIPALGNAVLVIVDSLTETASNEVRLQALSTLQALVSAIDDLDALASFLPRIVSSLTKVLTPTSSNRPSFKVLERGLNTLRSILVRVVGDAATQDLPEGKANPDTKSEEKTVRTKSWLQATASQLQIALANILKLRNHDKTEVRHALLSLCLSVIQDCRTALSDCTSMMIETLVTLAGRSGEKGTVEADLQTLLSSDTSLADLLRESLNGWVISLPRFMQSKDDASRRQLIHQVTVTIRLLGDEQVDMKAVDDLLASNLRDGIANVFQGPKGAASVTESSSNTELQTQLVLHDSNAESFPPLQLRLKGQDDMMEEFKFLVRQISKSKSAVTVAQDILNTLEFGNQETQLATFWLGVELLKDMIEHNSAVDDLLDFGTSDIQNELLDQLYNLSLSKLTESDADESHWHFQALSLEVVALQARQHKADFRVELIEALYPILHRLGDPNPGLRNHAIACLNIIADSCGYASATDLVISNVDYIVNAVGLRLNYHDLSPQAPQVLLMTMRLCGAPLLPYLDDLVGSMFTALERFHGYPKLVELLFSVLQGMVEEGVKAPQLTIEAGDEDAHKRTTPKATSVSDVVTLINSLNQEASKTDKEHEEIIESFPRRPWKEDDPKDEKAGNEDDNDTESNPPSQDNAVATSDPPPPAPRTFNLLLKISDLTQHYLTSPSPNLRTRLLSLLGTTIPALAKHENSFLPLINTLWPVLLPRLEDPEAFIVANTLDIIALICEHAGGFMKGRIEAAWQLLKALHERVQPKTSVNAKNIPKSKSISVRSKPKSPPSLHIIPNPSSTTALTTTTTTTPSPTPSTSTLSHTHYHPELYTTTPTLTIRSSLIHLFAVISEHVPVQDELFDDVLDILDPVLLDEKMDEKKGDVGLRRALERRNVDAVWLRVWRKGGMGAGKGGEGALKVPKVPEGKGWKFAALVVV